MLSFAEVSGVGLSCFVIKILKQKWSFVVGFFTSLAGGLLIMLLGTSYVNLMPAFVLLANFGLAMGFNIAYIGTSTLFPTLFVGTAFGITNFFARLLTILAPMVSEMPTPYPMVIFCVLTLFAIFASCFLWTGSE